MNIKDYKLKRPKQGYVNKKQRVRARRYNVSDWEVFFKGQKIGVIWYVIKPYWGAEWGWYHEKTKNISYDKSRQFAFHSLANHHYKENK